MMGSWRLNGKPPRQDRHHRFTAKIPKVILGLEIPVIWVFFQKSATVGYQLVSSRYPAAKSHTDNTVNYASCHAAMPQHWTSNLYEMYTSTTHSVARFGKGRFEISWVYDSVEPFLNEPNVNSWSIYVTRVNRLEVVTHLKLPCAA